MSSVLYHFSLFDGFDFVATAAAATAAASTLYGKKKIHT